MLLALLLLATGFVMTYFGLSIITMHGRPVLLDVLFYGGLVVMIVGFIRLGYWIGVQIERRRWRGG